MNELALNKLPAHEEGVSLGVFLFLMFAENHGINTSPVGVILQSSSFHHPLPFCCLATNRDHTQH